MNLAEIRKKAQREAHAELGIVPAPVPPAVQPEPQPEPQREPQREPQPEAEAADRHGDAQQESAAPLPERQQPAAAPAVTLQLRDYDPLELILKGRAEAAGAAEAGEKQEEQDLATLELLCFKISTEEYAISIMDVKEIIKPREVTEVPRTPPFVSGVLSLRGIIIPVFDLRVRLGLTRQEKSPRERIVVVKRQQGFCGVVVDQVVQVVRIGLAGVEPPPAVLDGIDRDFVHGIGRVDGRMLILLNMEKVLDVALS